MGQHGSWNRKPFSRYRLIFVPFSGGRPSGDTVAVLTGFINDAGDACGRPVGVVMTIGATCSSPMTSATPCGVFRAPCRP